jgi:hypothetical protein
MDRGNPRTRAARPPQKKRTPKQCSTYIIPGRSFPHREMGGVNLEKKMGEGYSQTTSSTLGNNLAYPIDAGPSQAIRRPIKGGGHGTIPNAHRGHRPERLAGGGPSTWYYPGLPLRMVGANGASYLTIISEARKNRPNPGMRHREDRRYLLTSRMRKARGPLARLR